MQFYEFHISCELMRCGNVFLAICDLICFPLIIFANNLDAGSKPFDTLKVFLKECFEKVYFEIVSRKQQTHEKNIQHEKK